jgi:hypothetical protein
VSDAVRMQQRHRISHRVRVRSLSSDANGGVVLPFTNELLLELCMCGAEYSL